MKRARAITLRTGAKTPMARVYQRKFNETHRALAKQFGRRVTSKPRQS
jgi:hypothetical protein